MTFPRTLIVIASGVALLAGTLIYTSSAEARWFRRHHTPEERSEAATEFLLWKLDATDEQQAAVRDIVERAHDDLATVELDPQAMHHELLDALAGETVDRAALESLRADRLSDAEHATQVLLDAIVEAAEVLTPEQRAQLPELTGKMGRRHGRHRGWHH